MATTTKSRATLTSIFTLKRIQESWASIFGKLQSAPFRDVIDYRDYHFFIASKAKRIRHDVLSARYRPQSPTRVRSQKSRGLNRVLTYLHPTDLIVYNLLCEQVHFAAKKFYSKNSFFSRARQTKEDHIISVEAFFNDNYSSFKQFKRYSKRRVKLGANSQEFPHVVFTDITNFFDAVHHDSIRDAVFPVLKSPDVVNLLLLFLESNILRPSYRARLHMGIPQDSFDCSRVLANLILTKVDTLLTKRVGDHWTRWMDDISFCAKTVPDAQLMIQQVTELLRNDSLGLNAGKTRILSTKEAAYHLLVDHNAALDQVERKIPSDAADAQTLLTEVWVALKKDRSPQYWEKVAARVFRCAALLRAPMLLPESLGLLCQHPGMHQAIFSYLESIPYDPQIMTLVQDYLRSGFDLYEEVRVRLLDCLMKLALPKTDRTSAIGLAWRILKNRSAGEYARAYAVLLLWFYGKEKTWDKLAGFLSTDEPVYSSPVIRRYLYACLLATDKTRAQGIMARTMSENGDIVKDVALFVRSLEDLAALTPQMKAAFQANATGGGVRQIGPRKLVLLKLFLLNLPTDLSDQVRGSVGKEFKVISTSSSRANLRSDELISQWI